MSWAVYSVRDGVMSGQGSEDGRDVGTLAC